MKQEQREFQIKLNLFHGKINCTGLNIGQAFEKSYNYNRTLDSHLIKNSEWGAFVYLAYSNYGKNGNTIPYNKPDNSNTDPQAYQSSTGNHYGIGCNIPMMNIVAAYLDNGNQTLSKNGQQLVSAENKYKNVYRTRNKRYFNR